MKGKIDIHTNKESLIKSTNLFPVVGIGASAGGLDAFKKLIKGIPENSGMAWVLVQHLDPKYESMLPELLQRVTKVPVIEISDEIKVEPNCIYIIPSNKILIANDGALQLSPRSTDKNQRNLPIDIFFASLAEVHQSHSIGVVLSGTATDGTQGLKAIKDHGGITIAQDEASAAYEGMPNSAIQAGVVDFILPPEQIPQKLLEITNHINKTIGNEVFPMQDEDVFKQILSLLRLRKGMDFTYYKQTTIRRRILRRMVLNKNGLVLDYLKFLRLNKQEQDVLYQDLLIPVTGFFRDPKTWINLCEVVFPELIKNKTDDGPLRLWVAGCSTGEEAYSMAICLKEFFEDHAQLNDSVGQSANGTRERLQIFATDLSEPAITKARTGIYAKTELLGISELRLKEFFTKNNGGYQVNKSIRDMCVFATHNFLKDPPFGKMDLISCRNVLIYMEHYLQKKAFTTFHYALNPKGFLLLGKSESVSQVSELFAPASAASGFDKLFCPKGSSRFMPIPNKRNEEIQIISSTNFKRENIQTDFQKTADDIILRKYTPAGVVVNELYDIVHFRGKTGDYLELSPGKPHLNLIKMGKNGLGFELRNLLHKAKKDNQPVRRENIPIQAIDLKAGVDSLRMVSIEAIPLPNMAEPHYLVLFHEAKEPGNQNETPKVKQRTGTALGEAARLTAHIAGLEKELAQTREDMRSITEDQEAANEELQSANEELLSSSEEMQSLNEEMETSKEELQSTNEELMVVNEELTNMNEQVITARNYAEAIVTTIREPLLVLNKNLRIKSANKSFYKTFQVTKQETEGRIIFELGNKQWDFPGLRTLLEKILPEKESFFDYEVVHNFQSIGQRHMLLNALEMTSEGTGEKLILLSIEDITERRKAAQDNAILSSIVSSSNDAIISKSLEGIISSWNSAAENIFGYTTQEAVGKNITLIVPPELLKEEQGVTNKIKNGQSVLHFETERLSKDGRRVSISLTESPVKDEVGKIIGASLIARDITLRKQATLVIKNNEERFQAAVAAVEGIVWTNNAKGEMEGEQQGWNALTGQSYEEYQGDGWAKAIHPDDVTATIEAWNEAVRKRTNFIIEHRVKIKNGNWRPFSVRAIPLLNPDGLVREWVGVHTDIHLQKLALEEQQKITNYFHFIADAMPQKVWTANTAGNFNYVNKCWLEYTGLGFDELMDWGWAKVVHTDDWEKTKARWMESIENGNNFEIEHRFVNTEGIYKWHLSRGLAQKDEYGNVEMWIGTNTEMHYIKQEEQRKDDFLKMVSHELKTPVTSIKGYVQLLLSTYNEKQEIPYSLMETPLLRIDNQITRLSKLISEMLDLSRLEVGKLDLQKTEFRLDELMRDTINDILITNTHHEIIISQSFACRVDADKNRIGQVIINLVNNALKYSPENKKVEVSIYPAKNNEVAVSVKDAGIGIDKEHQQKIFDRFYRVSGRSEKNYTGFGIGLFLANEIIQRHGHNITVQSKKGKGSVFTFTLPLLQEIKE